MPSRSLSRRRLGLVAIALALGALAGTPAPSAAVLNLPCTASGGGVQFGFEPDVFQGGGSEWLLLVTNQSLLYSSAAFDKVQAKGGKPVKLKDTSGIDLTIGTFDPPVNAKLKATITGDEDDFDLELTLKDKTNGRTVTANASGFCQV